jgi:fumarate reductase flavoprotein subunit
MPPCPMLADQASVPAPSPTLPRGHGRGYNAGVRDAPRLTELSPPRSRSGQPQPIETPPFFAIPICAGITNTMDGIAIDGHGRVKRPDGSVIAGLDAAGGATGGLEGGGALGYVGGLIKACVLGLRVAEDAARRR